MKTFLEMREFAKSKKFLGPSETDEELLERINELGTIREILHDKEKLLKILTYFGDRHLLLVFCDEVDKALNEGEITIEDLELMSSEWFILNILNLEELLKHEGRRLYDYELADKICYMSHIRHIDFLNKFYSNSQLLIKTKTEHGSIEEYRYWLVSGVFSTLPLETQLNIAEKYIEIGYVADGKFIVKMVKEILKRHRKYWNLSRQTLENYQNGQESSVEAIDKLHEYNQFEEYDYFPYIESEIQIPKNIHFKG